jgi:hypothetical protein
MFLGVVITKLTQSFVVFVLFAGCCVVRVQPQSVKSPTASSAITGRVTQHGKGLNDVLVKAWPQSSSQPPRNGGALETKTDADGNYRITPVAPGNYFVGFDRPGLVSEKTGLLGSPQAAAVSAGESAAVVNFHLITGGVITGRVTRSDGLPLADEPIMLIEVNPQPSPTMSLPNPVMLPFISGIFKTDDRGVYRVFGIPPGSYKVAAGAAFPAFTAIRGQPSYRRTFFPGTTDEGKARALEVHEATVTSNIDINVGSTVPTYSASGRIVNSATGEPLPDTAYDIHITAPPRGYGGEIPKAGSTNNRGEFNIESLPAGRYVVKISEPNFLTSERGRFFGESASFEVRDASVNGIELKAVKTTSVSGLVIIRNTSDKTIMARASQVKLLFEVLPSAGGRYTYQTAKPEPDLSFRIPGLKPGKLRILINSREDEALGFRFLRTELADSTAVRDVQLSGDREVSGIRVVLVYGSGSVSGVVKFENGSLPEALKVGARITNDEGFYAFSWADSRGNFRIEAVPAGNYTLTVGAEVPGKRTLGKTTSQPISVVEGRELQTTIALDVATIRAEAP